MREDDRRRRTLRLIETQNTFSSDETRIAFDTKNLRLSRLEKHSCITGYEERCVPVDKNVMLVTEYPVKYCRKCDVYVVGDAEQREQFEFNSADLAGKYLTFLQMRTNLAESMTPFPLLKDKVKRPSD